MTELRGGVCKPRCQIGDVWSHTIPRLRGLTKLIIFIFIGVWNDFRAPNGLQVLDHLATTWLYQGGDFRFADLFQSLHKFQSVTTLSLHVLLRLRLRVLFL